MAFSVTGCLNGQNKVLKIPVVKLQLKSFNKSKKPIRNYQFQTVYCGRNSRIKKTNVRGVATVKTLAGQKIKIIHVAENKFTINIINDGLTKWSFRTDKLIDHSSITSSISNVSSSPPSSSQKPNNRKLDNISTTDKGNVIRKDKITPTGPIQKITKDEARAMWGKRSLYGQVGKAVHDVGSRYHKYGEAWKTKEIVKAIRSYLAQGKRTSNHCVTFEIYAKLNVVDLGNNSNGFIYYKNKKKYPATLGKNLK